jgi:Arc/MetJ-type ribon-helix-helix transcriptional regulator
MTTLSIKLPQTLADRIARAAVREGISRSEFLRKAAEAKLQPRPAARKRKPTAYELTADLCGSVQSGVPDLGTNPKYMEGFGEWKR